MQYQRRFGYLHRSADPLGRITLRSFWLASWPARASLKAIRWERKLCLGLFVLTVLVAACDQGDRSASETVAGGPIESPALRLIDLRAVRTSRIIPASVTVQPLRAAVGSQVYLFAAAEQVDLLPRAPRATSMLVLSGRGRLALSPEHWEQIGPDTLVTFPEAKSLRIEPLNGQAIRGLIFCDSPR